ncbi:DUF3795 domain-containing protein [Anaerotignum sp.]|uniref:DUF3795 domain-containing protein n=1 Tax=Anaerotignum sp. TaxID=2039241 RepID=UPI003735BAFB
MTETFCGKDCDLCQEKQSETCRGCKEGPGRRFGGNCPIADCCREKYHANCDTCQEAMSCAKRQQKDQMPQLRIAEAEAKDEKEVQKREKAKVLGKWLWILFWLFIASLITGLLSQDSLSQVSPQIYFIGTVSGIVIKVIYCLILLQLRHVEEKYGKAGICSIISALLAVVVLLIVENSIALALIMLLAATVIGLAVDYFFFYGNAAVLEDFDLEFSEKWKKLWTWNLISIGVMTAGICLIFLGIVGAILVIVGGLGVFVISIMQLVYLYRMAVLFKEYT